jgi:integrating conjugative element protein (TIGR03761 family)
MARTTTPKKAAAAAPDASGNSAKPAGMPFPVSAASPFPDRYDIEGERTALRDLIDTDDFERVTLDPRYPRYIELERREELLRQDRKTHELRDGAESVVEYREAGLIRTGLGKLTDEEVDSMSLHTRESSRLFMGRQVEPGKQGYGQSGGKKVGAALRAIWYLSGNDNPYADFALIEATTRISQQIQELDKLTQEMEDKLTRLRQRGLNFSVLKADPPVTVELGFRSPYGYSVVNLISTFDYHVRVVKTMVRKDLMSDKDGYAALYTQTRRCRSIFERVIWFQRYLMREELRVMSRLDWLPTADEAAKKRVQAAVGIFGELPREVFNGATAPRHSRRRLDLSDQELRMLDEVPLAGTDLALEAATESLV